MRERLVTADILLKQSLKQSLRKQYTAVGLTPAGHSLCSTPDQAAWQDWALSRRVSSVLRSCVIYVLFAIVNKGTFSGQHFQHSCCHQSGPACCIYIMHLMCAYTCASRSARPCLLISMFGPVTVCHWMRRCQGCCWCVLTCLPVDIFKTVVRMHEMHHRL